MNFKCPKCSSNKFSYDKNRQKKDDKGKYWISRKTCLNCGWKKEFNLINSMERARKLGIVK